jgi:cytochrome c
MLVPRSILPHAVLAMSLMAAGCFDKPPAPRVTDGDPRRAPALIEAYGCGTCHRIPGVNGALGRIGPPLTRFADRAYVAGVLANTPANLVHWIRNPQSVVPGNAMPDMGVTERDARDIAAYLYATSDAD